MAIANPQILGLIKFAIKIFYLSVSACLSKEQAIPNPPLAKTHCQNKKTISTGANGFVKTTQYRCPQLGLDFRNGRGMLTVLTTECVSAP